MIDQTPIARKAFLSALIIVVLSFGNKLVAQNGKALFQENCARCHNLTKDMVGPKMEGIQDRVPDRELLKAWIKNSTDVIASGNEYFNDLFKRYNNTPMPPFTHFTDADLEALVDYITTPPPAPKVEGGGSAPVEEQDNSILYGILTLILAVVALIMLQVNSSLKKLSDDKEGIPAQEPIPFWRNKSYIALLTVILFIVGGYYVVKGAINMGRHHDYQPEQPIYYSHKVHAGTNQINCLYCHNGAYEGKQANIPSVNVCMNCHISITEYNGEKLYREDGTEVDGTAEIQKIFAAAGYDPQTKQYTGKGKEIEWVRIHNLPDHVYFNHSQHTKVGGVQCQTCHGDINNMHEVRQFSDLSMGWCVNCHRTTGVKFDGKDGNEFYSIYEKYHNEIKAGTRDSVTVSDIGGLDCQKCHY
jgi:mono/diheme cytochrome c family protein